MLVSRMMKTGFCLALVFVAGFGFFSSSACGKSVSVECDVHAGTCKAALGNGVDIVLEIAPKPVKAMQELTFTLTLSGGTPSADPYIDLGMPGMKMGPNRVDLKPMDDGSYQGKGFIVRCPSGKRIWKADITIPGVGEAEFVFDVVY